jgi:hypothetical protein
MGKRVTEVKQERETEREAESSRERQAGRQKAGIEMKDKLGTALALPIHLLHISPSSKLCGANCYAALISPCLFTDALLCG